MKKALILGGSGLVGQSLIKELSSNYDIYATYNKHNINLKENKKICLDIDNYLKLISFIFNNLISNLKSNNTIEVYSNYYKTTNLDVILAKQIHYIIDTNLKGTFHLCSTDIINNYDFIYELVTRLGFRNANLKKVKIEDIEKYHLAIQSKRCELPNELQITNKDIINYLTN
ncbi:MAG: hypothetical protein PUE01_07995 [Clostridiaceae bacterium]|nr:hypothetical protein [Clostridiaceae bacterium]